MSLKKLTVAALAGAAMWGGYAASTLANPTDIVLMWAALQEPRPELPADLPTNWPQNTWNEGAVSGVNWDSTWEMMWLSELAYGDELRESTIHDCAGKFGYTFHELYEDDLTGLESELLVAERDDRIVFSVQGTHDILPDGFTDGQIQLVNFQGVKVHKGFYMQAQALFPVLDHWLDTLDPHGRTVWFTGHSLGGAVSQLLAVMTVNAYLDRGLTPPNVQIVTFGSPMVGDSSWEDLYENELRLGGATIRWVNQQDLVSNLPIRDRRYKHVGRRFQVHEANTRVCELERFESEAAYREATGQEPICHNKTRFWLERDAPEYAWKLFDTSAEQHALVGDYGYRSVFERLVPAAQSHHLALGCNTTPDTEPQPPLPVNPEGCPFETPYCCETETRGTCNLCRLDRTKCD